MPEKTHQNIGPLSDGLADRLAQGFGATADAGRDQAARSNDDLAWEKGLLGEVFRAVNRTQNARIALTRVLGTLTECFDQDPGSVRALLHRPGEALRRLQALLTGDLENRPELEDEERWRIFTGTVELLWEYLHSDTPQARPHRHLEPLAARTRFLALSEPFRHLGHSAWHVDDWTRNGDLAKVFGHEAGVELIRRTREAREIWRARLNGYQSVPLLDYAPPLAVEEEVRALAFTGGFSGNVLVLADPCPPEPKSADRSDRTEKKETEAEEKEKEENAPSERPGSGRPSKGRPSSVAIPPAPADRAVLEEVVEQYLLPRFAIGRAWAAVLGPRRSGEEKRAWFRRPPNLLFFAVGGVALLALAATVAALAAEWMPYWPALVLAGSVYVLIGAGALLCGRLWAMPLMLRLPAAAALGLIVLVALHPDWWTAITPGWGLIWVVVLLVGASCGYLLIEARNHNPGQLPDEGGPRSKAAGRILGRALVVALTGAAHAFLIALLGMAVIAPAFSEDGDRLRIAWTTGEEAASAPGQETAPSENPSGGQNGEPPRTPGEPWAILAAATAWCLAAGVFSQILWDDQPITAPLAHRRWRSER
ncbi:hypothetical protein [Nocardiopsis potens]|uniref:hypothetical protein n=1 Tax=Nocardiopsis potens TaxID=1246458 RepID=UPI0012695ACD|nr:hypothetical protein [Nocardiopsis potens]